MSTSPTAAMDDAGQEKPASTTGSTPGTKATRQRFKPQLSCTFCRSRKLKCDRNQPCENCVKRDMSSTCNFLHAGIIRDKATVKKSQGTPKDVHGRIRHLEELVVSLMQRSATNPDGVSRLEHLEADFQLPGPSPQPSLSDTSESLGRFSIEDDQTKYIGGSHWAAILDSIAGLKDSLEYNDDWSKDEENQWKGPREIVGPDLLVGCIPKASKSEILASIPPRSLVDQLAFDIFEAGNIGPCAVHEAVFRREYEQFWANPQACPVMWIGLLYGIMCVATNLRIMGGNRGPNIFAGLALRDPAEAAEIFREKAVQCLVLGNYTEPTKHTVEALFCYSLCEHFRNPDAQVGGWHLTGILARTAMRLGYHRDADHYPNISALRGEMQRRLWSIILHLDIATSCQVGLPRMIKEDSFDTKNPRNLLDNDFDENTKVLPPGRPLSETTQIGHVVMKHDLTMVFGKISDQSNDLEPVPYDEVMKLDRLLEEARERIPEELIVHKMEDLKVGPAELTVRRFSTDLIYHKARCVLHRKFLVPQKSSATSPYPYSIKSCVDSAMAILHSQGILHIQTQPGQRLYEHRWKTSTLITQDFMLAAMLICLYLSQSTGESFLASANIQSDFPIKWTRAQMLEALDGSFSIWNSLKFSSKDALKAAKALKAMIARLRGTGPSNLSVRTQSQSSQPFDQEQSPDLAQLTPEGSSQTSSSSPWQTASLSSLRYPAAGIDFNQTSYPVVDNMIDAPMNLNWELWDNHFLPDQLADPSSDLWNINNPSFATYLPNTGTGGMDYLQLNPML